MGTMKISDFFSDIAARLTNIVFPLKCLKCSRFISISNVNNGNRNNNINRNNINKVNSGSSNCLRNSSSPVSGFLHSSENDISSINHLSPHNNCHDVDLNFHSGCLKKSQILIMQDICHFKTDMEIIRALFSEFFCNKCINKAGFILFAPPFCIKCGTKLKTSDGKNTLCKECKKNMGGVGKVRACGMYQGILRESIHFFKYNKKIQLARPLGFLLFLAFEKYFSMDHIDFILPIPLHRKKLAKRGFNQAFLLLKDFKKFTKICKQSSPEWEIDYNIIARIKNTKSQTNFDKEKRRKNIQGAFKVVKPDKVKGKHILLIDDVYTSGATTKEAASLLLNANALSVDVLVLARA